MTIRPSFIRISIYSILISIFFVACSTGTGKVSDDEPTQSGGWEIADEIVNNIKVPEFSTDTFDIRNYGAVGDGEKDCTDAIKETIEACNAQSGGVVLVPKGTFLTGAVHLLSNVNLHVSEGATLLFTKDKSKYLPEVHTRFEGMECMNYSPFIYAYKQENIAITGKGTIDGQGEAWWSWKGPWDGEVETGWEEGKPNQLPDNEILLKMVENDVALNERVFGEGHYLRPSFIQPYDCENILIEEIKIINSPMWIIHPVLSESITVRKVRIESYGPNNDGCNPESCKNVLIVDCYFDTGDDCIAIKSGRNNEGRKFGVPSENIVIRDCVMKEGHGGIVIGSEVSGNVRNVFAENCILDSPHLDRALRIKSNSVRGGVIENIYFRNSEVKQVKEAVVKINMFYSSDRSNFIPMVRNVKVENITSHKSNFAIWVKAYEEKPVEGLVVRNCSFKNVKHGIFVENIKNFDMSGVDIMASAGTEGKK